MEMFGGPLFQTNPVSENLGQTLQNDQNAMSRMHSFQGVSHFEPSHVEPERWSHHEWFVRVPLEVWKQATLW